MHPNRVSVQVLEIHRITVNKSFVRIGVDQRQKVVSSHSRQTDSHTNGKLLRCRQKGRKEDYANSWRSDHLKLEAAVVVLMGQMVNRTAKANVSIVEDVRDKFRNPFEFYGAIKKALIAGDGSAESIRTECNAMVGIGFSHNYDFQTVKRHFEDLFLKFKSQNRNIGFTDLKKV